MFPIPSVWRQVASAAGRRCQRRGFSPPPSVLAFDPAAGPVSHLGRRQADAAAMKQCHTAQQLCFALPESDVSDCAINHFRAEYRCTLLVIRAWMAEGDCRSAARQLNLLCCIPRSPTIVRIAAAASTHLGSQVKKTVTRRRFCLCRLLFQGCICQFRFVFVRVPSAVWGVSSTATGRDWSHLLGSEIG